MGFFSKKSPLWGFFVSEAWYTRVAILVVTRANARANVPSHWVVSTISFQCGSFFAFCFESGRVNIHSFVYNVTNSVILLLGMQNIIKLNTFTASQALGFAYNLPLACVESIE